MGRVVISDMDSAQVRPGERYVFTYSVSPLGGRVLISDWQAKVAAWVAKIGSSNYEIENVVTNDATQTIEVYVRVKDMAVQQAGFWVIFGALAGTATILMIAFNLSLSKVERITEAAPEVTKNISMTATIVAGIAAMITGNIILRKWIK